MPVTEYITIARRFIRVRFDLPDRLGLQYLAEAVDDVAIVDLFARDLIDRRAIAGSHGEPLTSSPRQRSVTHVVQVRYGSELSLLLEALPTIGGSAVLAWLLTFARDLPGKLRESVEAGRQAALETRRLEAATLLEEADANGYVASKQLQLEIARRLAAAVRDAAAPHELLTDGRKLEQVLDDEVIRALVRLSTMISAVDDVDESDVAE